MDLTPIQRDILNALINLHRQHETVVKGEAIARLIDRNPGTVRNQMQLLKALSLVEGVPGPKGGYRPTGTAYQVMDIENLQEETLVPIYRNGEFVENTTVAEISLTTVRSTEKCNGLLKILGNTKAFAAGDSLQIGPTPINRLIVRGVVFGRDDTNNSLLINICEMVSLPQKTVSHYMRPLSEDSTLRPDDSLADASSHFIKYNIHGAAVEDSGKIVGVATTTDITRAVSQNRTEDRVKDIMTKELITVDGEMQLYDVVKLFQKYNIGQLIVTIDGVPKGILSKTDVMNELSFC
ncbi:MAG: CBS domain-containing protein [Methanosarcinaceae archaeon]|nr:CBS domain-containing protein [Methanosarcinaceae archaeon]